ncbi:MAG: hypothetical protein ACOCP4_07040 [Candidatus Woesearchaeota archaeon]
MVVQCVFKSKINLYSKGHLYHTMAEEIISLNECLRIAASNNKEQSLEITAENALRTTINFKKSYQMDKAYSQLTIESYYVKNPHGRTIVYETDPRDNLQEYTKYFSEGKTILESHQEVVNQINKNHDQWYVKTHKENLDRNQEDDFPF